MDASQSPIPGLVQGMHAQLHFRPPETETERAVDMTSSLRYVLEMVQHPVHARSKGSLTHRPGRRIDRSSTRQLGDEDEDEWEVDDPKEEFVPPKTAAEIQARRATINKDLRPLDPPPVLRVRIFDDDCGPEPGNTVDNDVTGALERRFLCCATLVDAEGLKRRHLAYGGTVVPVSVFGHDHMAVFGELYLRRPGQYHLVFELMEVHASGAWLVRASTACNQFQVYSPRDFSKKKGLSLGRSTPLTNKLHDMGARIISRKRDTSRVRRKLSRSSTVFYRDDEKNEGETEESNLEEEEAEVEGETQVEGETEGEPQGEAQVDAQGEAEVELAQGETQEISTDLRQTLQNPSSSRQLLSRTTAVNPRLLRQYGMELLPPTKRSRVSEHPSDVLHEDIAVHGDFDPTLGLSMQNQALLSTSFASNDADALDAMHSSNIVDSSVSTLNSTMTSIDATIATTIASTMASTMAPTMTTMGVTSNIATDILPSSLAQPMPHPVLNLNEHYHLGSTHDSEPSHNSQINFAYPVQEGSAALDQNLVDRYYLDAHPELQYNQVQEPQYLLQHQMVQEPYQPQTQESYRRPVQHSLHPDQHSIQEPYQHSVQEPQFQQEIQDTRYEQQSQYFLGLHGEGYGNQAAPIQQTEESQQHSYGQGDQSQSDSRQPNQEHMLYPRNQNQDQYPNTNRQFQDQNSWQ